jgi:hypothetical protein
MSHHVAIIIVSFDNPEDVITCLDALKLSTYRDFSVHISENAGRQAFEALWEALLGSGLADAPSKPAEDRREARLFDDDRPLRILSSPDNPGYAGGINRCLDLIDAFDAVWILNPDTSPTPSALGALVDRARTGGFDITGGRFVDPDTRKVQLYGGCWRPLIARGYNIGRGEPEDAVPDTAAIEARMSYVGGACMLVTRRYFETIGRMRDDYFLYCEEIDWCLRRGALRLGYAHDCIVYHAHGTTIGSSSDRRRRSRLSVYLDERNKLLLTRRCYPALYPLVLLTTLALTAQYLRHGAWRNFLVALDGWWAGARGETGKPYWFTRGKSS